MREFEKMIVKENHEYRVQNQSLQLLGDTFETPFYLYDLDLIAKQYKSLYQYIPWPALKIHYAMKANYNKDILVRLREANACIDAVSPAEVLLALALGFKPEKIIFISLSGINPCNSIKSFAISTILTGCPISSKNISPPFAKAPA